MNRKVLIALMWAGGLGAAIALSLFSGEAPEESTPRAGGFVERGELDPEETTTNAAASPASARQFRGGPGHQGQVDLEGPSSGQLAWRFETGARITAQPVADARGNIYVGSHDQFFYAISASGQERWKHDLGDSVYSTAVIDSRGNIYVGSDGGALWSFDEDGDLRWKREFDDDVDTAITLVDIGGQDTLVFGAGPLVVAMDLDGETRFRFEAGGKVFAAPAVDSNGNIYVGSQDDTFFSLSPEGELRWRYTSGGDNDASPVLSEDTVYFGSDDEHVHALSLDGELRWSVHVDGMVRAPLGLSRDGSVLLGVFGPRPRVMSLSAEDGRSEWEFGVTIADTTEFGVSSGPISDASGNLYFGAHDDYFYSLSATGELRWAFETGGDVDTCAVLTERHLVFAADDKHVYALTRE